jgi:hypothetical protein
MTERSKMTREQLETLADQIADLSLRIDMAKHSLLTHLREFDARDGWSGSGFISTASWLAWRIDIDPGAGREHVRVARALGELGRVDAEFATGKLSYSKVRAITRVATPETEQDFLDIATGATAAQIEKIVRAYRRTRIDPGEPALDLRRFVRRAETRSGMVRIEAQLTPEQAKVVWEALSAALDAGRRENVSAETGASSKSCVSVETPHAQVDPLVLQAERTDALVSVAQSYLQHDEPRTLGSGYELVVMTTKEQLEQGPGGIGGFLRDGTPVPLHVARMLACDCSRVDVEVAESGEVLDVGRARRTIPSAIGRALWIRDGGCRVPSCGRRHHLHGHHIEAWAEGGKTSACNLILLCPSHHTLVHEGQLIVEIVDGKVEFRNAYGLPLRPAPDRGQDLEAIDLWLRSEPDYDHERFPTWDGTRLDLDEVLSWMWVAEKTRRTMASHHAR